MSSQQPLQTNILGFEGPPATLFSSYDADAMILTVVATMPYQPKPREGCLVISNDTTMHRDSPFTDRDMKDAIGAYFQLRYGFGVDGKSTRLNFGRRARQIQADGYIEIEGTDEKGKIFNVKPSITNEIVALLATCRWAITGDGVKKNLEGLEALNEILLGHQLFFPV